MLNIPERTTSVYTRDTISDINKIYNQYTVSSGNISTVNNIMPGMNTAAAAGTPQTAPPGSTFQPRTDAPQNPGGFSQSSPDNNNTASAYRQPYPPAYGSQGAPPRQTYGGSYPPPQPAPASPPPAPPMPAAKPMPNFTNPTRKGMKSPLPPQCRNIKACLGWKINDSRCDVDASAFLLDDTEKILSEDWFVFYGQPQSPDRSVIYRTEDPLYQKYFEIDLAKLNRSVKKIVFVVTIDEALSKNLNFGMLRDVYIRLVSDDGSEILSFLLGDYYENVTSMMVGELYIHKGQWKFNAIGNGVARDLAGLCSFYGIETI